HDYAAAALEKGASAIIVRNSWIKENPLEGGTAIAVDDTLDFLQKLSAWHRSFFEGKVVGITGSNGKTTTREMVSAVLEQSFRVFRSEGNKNNHIGLPLMMLDMDMQADYAVLEMGTNHPGEIAHLANLAKPDVALVTNVGKGHVGFFDGLDGIYIEKTSIYNAVEDGTILINMEDERLRNYQSDRHQIMRIGYTPDCDVWGMTAERDEKGCLTFLLNGEIDVKLAIPGDHQLLNALMAAGIGILAGMDLKHIKAGLEAFKPANKRMDFFERDDILFLNDAYNANPDSMRAAISYLAEMKEKGHRAVLVMGDMLELGDYEEDEHAEIGRLAIEKELDLVLLYGPASKTALREMRGNSGDTESNWYSSHESIADHLQDYLEAGDVVLLKGSRGMQMEKVLTYLHGETTGA
ncbi:MAG: UDP-N-acetylmuramoyl-tripeptide--D-alanyl-D-alanine ligase, partial [Calditrichota bacterium]